MTKAEPCLYVKGTKFLCVYCDAHLFTLTVDLIYGMTLTAELCGGGQEFLSGEATRCKRCNHPWWRQGEAVFTARFIKPQPSG